VGVNGGGMDTRTSLYVFGAGIGLGAAVTIVSFAAWTSQQPAAKPAEPTRVVCEAAPAEACPSCPACPEPTLVKDPPPPGETTENLPPANPYAGTMLTQRECERARKLPMQVSDDKLAECARGGLLGTCKITAGSADTMCHEYVKIDGLCDEKGVCGPPLNGTGCTKETFYGGGTSFFNCTGNDSAVAGCMVRKLAKAGYCKPLPK
jgi:hypothetical protein